MTMRAVDLHVHSNKSDGSLTPAALAAYAKEKNLSAFALTDHDTTEGLKEAISAGEALGIRVIPGIEFSTEYKGKDIHIVGLFIDEDSPVFKAHIQEFVDARIQRNIKMCARLKEGGIDITYERLTELFPGSVITRGHYARYLYEQGYVKSMPEAFGRFLGDHCKYFVPREKITPSQAVDLIHQADGIAILAHPLLYGLGKNALNELTASLKEKGLDGIEAIYCTHTPSDERKVRTLAAKYELLISGGSDFHGGNKPNLELGTGYGKLFVPEDVLTALENRQRELAHEK